MHQQAHEIMVLDTPVADASNRMSDKVSRRIDTSNKRFERGVMEAVIDHKEHADCESCELALQCNYVVDTIQAMYDIDQHLSARFSQRVKAIVAGARLLRQVASVCPDTTVKIRKVGSVYRLVLCPKSGLGATQNGLLI